MPRLLDGLLVLDFTRVLAGPFCTMILADLGARVVKVEPPGGDEARHYGPMVSERSTYFASVNRGKESICLNLKDPRAQALALRLAERADVLVENFRPGTLERLGVGYERVVACNPRIVYASVSGFGQTGPYRDRGAYDVIIQAMGGLMGITGPETGEPTRVGTSVGDIIPALYTTVAILAALRQRDTTGQGVRLDIGMMDAVVAITENAMARYWASRTSPRPIGNRHPAITPFSTYPSADGYVVVAAGNNTLWQRLCQTIGRPDLADDRRFATNDLRTVHVDDLTRELSATLSTRTTDEWIEVLLAVGVPCGRVNMMADLATDPHLHARNMIVELEQPGLGPFLTPGTPIKAPGFDDILTRPSPEFAQHTSSVLREVLGLDEADIAGLRAARVVE
ncbi:MAG: CoA transferase [Chloroflexi bacterium]|nr:CoA transferase [Chloroflexota bacterium]